MPKLVHEELLVCCGFKRCPTVRVFEDGSIELSDSDTENGSMGNIKLRPEVAGRLAELISQHKQ